MYLLQGFNFRHSGAPSIYAGPLFLPELHSTRRGTSRSADGSLLCDGELSPTTERPPKTSDVAIETGHHHGGQQQ